MHSGSDRLYLASTDYTHRLPGKLPQFGAAGAGAGADCNTVHCGRCEERKRRRIRIVLQLAVLTCRSETSFKIGVNHMQSRRDTVPDRNIFAGFGYRGPDHKAAARAYLTRQIHGQRRVVGKHQASAEGAVLRESLARCGQACLPIMRERLEIERVLVTECRIEARRIHACRSSNAVEGSTGVAGLQEGLRCPLECGLCVIGRRGPPTRWSGFAFFSCHIAKYLVAACSHHICMNRYKIKWANTLIAAWWCYICMKRYKMQVHVRAFDGIYFFAFLDG